MKEKYNFHDSTCGRCNQLLRLPMDSEPIWEPQIACIGCNYRYHISCTIIQDEATMNGLGMDMHLWRCHKCLPHDSPNYQLLTEKLQQVKDNQQPLYVNEPESWDFNSRPERLQRYPPGPEPWDFNSRPDQLQK